MPVHSTAFRPIDDASLARNPFRVFTSLLRLELIENEILRQKAAEILRQRDIFTPRCRQLLEEYEQQGGFNETQAQEFVQEALENVSLAPVSNGR
ncbi:putative cytoplasmic protein [Escherichia coli]|uniref:2-oxoadipate dioxygenase/decarboxylase n=1 Tax=Escherichia coli TaxID=562 RepID=A0A376TFV2_ECOLX|nr:putative cytoplasmic protein [Escherichia coli]